MKKCLKTSFVPIGTLVGRDGKKEIAPPNMKVAIKQPAKKKQDIWDDKEFKAGGGVGQKYFLSSKQY